MLIRRVKLPVTPYRENVNLFSLFVEVPQSIGPKYPMEEIKYVIPIGGVTSTGQHTAVVAVNDESPGRRGPECTAR